MIEWHTYQKVHNGHLGNLKHRALLNITIVFLPSSSNKYYLGNCATWCFGYLTIWATQYEGCPEKSIFAKFFILGYLGNSIIKTSAVPSCVWELETCDREREDWLGMEGMGISSERETGVAAALVHRFQICCYDIDGPSSF